MGIQWLKFFAAFRNVLYCIVFVLFLGLFVACGSQPPRAEQHPFPPIDIAQAESAGLPTQPAHTPAKPPSVTGQHLSFGQFSLEEGLSSNLVQAVLQDRQGYIWFGTMEGLNKYDGYEVKVYRPDPDNPNSLSDTVINGVYEDRAGNLWVATTNGLNKFDPVTETFTRYQHDPADPNSLSGNAFSVVDGFYEDQTGQLWFSTWTAGLNKFDPATETFTRYQHDPADPDSLRSDVILKMASSHDGTKLWLGTPLGMAQFDLATETFTHYRHDPTNPNSLSDDEVNSTYATTLDGQPVVWVGTGDGRLNQFDPVRETFIRHQVGQTKITEIYEDDDGLLWLGTQGQGVFLFDPDRGSVVGRYQNDLGNPGSLGADLVNHIYQDQAGAIWIATYTGGVSRLAPWQKAFQLYRHQPDDPNSLSSSEIYALDLDRDGILWIATLDTGLNRFDPATETFTRYLHNPDNPNSLSHNIVTNVLADRQGLVWIATVGGGLNRFDPATETFTHYRHEATNPNSLLSDGVLDLFEDSRGMLWIGMADTGLSRFDPATETFTHYPPDPSQAGTLSDASISAILEDSQGRLWVGSKQGLDRFDPTTEQFTNYRHDSNDPDSLSHNYVKSIFEDDAGILWLTTDVGLNRFDPATEQFRHYLARDGLAHDQLGSIIADDEGYLWLGTSGGLSRFDPRSETFRNYNRHDGLQGDIFYPYAATRSPDGTLYFGGANGLNVFHPAELTNNPYPPAVVLTEFHLFNEPVTPGHSSSLPKQISFLDEITLAHDQSVLGFEFVALNYTAPAKNQYAYMLEGFDQDWTYMDGSRRFARYTNLDPGSYTFRVKASNNDGVWNETGASVNLIMTPPWWGTHWFRGLVLALIVGLALGGFQWRVWRIKQRGYWLEAQVDERTKALQASEAALRQAKQAAEAANQAKSVFLANMSHELRTPLNTIQGYAHILRDRSLSNDDSDHGLQAIQRSGDHLLTLIDDVLDIARIEAERIELQPSNFHLLDFLGELAEIVRLRAKQKGLAFQFETVVFAIENLQGTTRPPTTNGSVVLPMMVHGDARRLRQILLNLLTNAIKFTQQGQVIFRVGSVAPQSPLLRFQIEDTGPGLAAEDLDRIFEPFQQVNPDRQPVGGVGLGLTISRHLVQVMGGDLRVTSMPGQGSTFWFDLPLPAGVEVQNNEEEHRRIIGIHGRRPKILVVDDIADNRAVVVRQLLPLGFDMAEAGDAAEGMVRAAAFDPEVIIVDLMLPDIDGFTLIRQLRQHPLSQHAVIIVSSASVFAEDRDQSMAAGADAFLPKPIKPAQLLEMLGQYLHLEWRYGEEHGHEPMQVLGSSSAPLSVANLPTQEALLQLYELTTMGHAAALQAQADELARSDERLAPFAAEVKRMARGLQMNELSAFFEQYVER